MGIKKLLFLTAIITYSIAIYADEYEDDIYYNPNSKVEQVVITTTDSYTNGTEINGRDVDEYNRYGGYYHTPIDEIGATVSSEEDFVYTKQIQKFYNPTIIVDNSKILEDILNNSYGNVDIVYNCGVPEINIIYSMNAYAPYPYYTFNPWYWSFTTSWAWNPYWFDPFYSWYGPYSYWWRYPYPPYGPGYYPPYYPGYHPPHHGPGHNPHPSPNWRPGGNTPHGPGPGWSGNSRPGGNGGHRVNGVPQNGHSNNGNVQYNGNNHRVSGVTNNNNNQQVSGRTTNTQRQNTTVVNQNNGSNNRNSGVRNNNNRRNNNQLNNYQNLNNHSQGSFNQGGGNRSGRGSGGSFGGGRTGGGHRGGGGGHRR